MPRLSFAPSPESTRSMVAYLSNPPTKGHDLTVGCVQQHATWVVRRRPLKKGQQVSPYAPEP